MHRPQETPPKLSELALNILWNLAFRSEANRNQLGRLGVIPPLVGILMRKSSTGVLRQQAARLLASVTSQHAENHHEAVAKGAIVPLVAMLSGNDADKVTNTQQVTAAMHMGCIATAGQWFKSILDKIVRLLLQIPHAAIILAVQHACMALEVCRSCRAYACSVLLSPVLLLDADSS